MPSVSPLPAPALAAARPQDAPPGAAGRAHPAVVLVLIAAGALRGDRLWWYGTPAIHGLGDWLTNAGRVTGLLAGYGVVVLVALMARLPPLERGIGADRLARWHAMGGRYTVCLVVAHALLIIWGYAVTRAHHGRQPDQDAADELPGRDGGDRGRLAARRRRHQLGARGAAQAALRDLVLPALLHLPGDRPRVQPPVRGRRASSSAACRPASLWGGMYVVVAAAILWYRFITPGPAGGAAPDARARCAAPEAPGVVSVVIGGWHLSELARRVRPVLPLALPDPRPVVGVVALLAVGTAASGGGCGSP